MKYLSLALCGVVLLMGYIGREHYKAVQHEFYQVWDSMEEIKDVGS